MALVTGIPDSSCGKRAGRLAASPSADRSSVFRQLDGTDEIYYRAYGKYQAGVTWHHTNTVGATKRWTGPVARVRFAHGCASHTRKEAAMQAIAETLRGLGLGPASGFVNLRVYPLLAPGLRARDYLTLAEALERGTVVVTEISEGGSVPELLLDNRGDAKVLLLDGEDLIGAKQNRVLNISILVGAKRKVKIPVSCVEHGRWRRSSAGMRSGESVLSPLSRSYSASEVSVSMSLTGMRRSNQGRVWSDVDTTLRTFVCDSDTGALSDIYEQQRSRLDEYVRSVRVVRDQVGVVFELNGEVLGMDLFDATDSLARLLPRLVKSYALDAIEHPGAGDARANPLQVSAFLEQVAVAPTQVFPSTDLGQDVRFTGESIMGGALVEDGRVIHLVAFSRQAVERGRRGADASVWARGRMQEAG